MTNKEHEYIYEDGGGYDRKISSHSNLVHRTIAYKEIYLKNKEKYKLPFSKYVVHHKDNNKKNNNVSNLQIMTQADHEEHHGINKKSQEDHKKLTQEDLKRIRRINAKIRLNRQLVEDEEHQRKKERQLKTEWRHIETKKSSDEFKAVIAFIVIPALFDTSFIPWGIFVFLLWLYLYGRKRK